MLFEHLPVPDLGLGVAPLLAQHVAEVVARVDVGGCHPQGGPDRLLGRLVLAALGQKHAQELVQVGVVGAGLQAGGVVQLDADLDGLVDAELHSSRSAICALYRCVIPPRHGDQ